jgi:hypothetical protein
LTPSAKDVTITLTSKVEVKVRGTVAVRVPEDVTDAELGRIAGLLQQFVGEWEEDEDREDPDEVFTEIEEIEDAREIAWPDAEEDDPAPESAPDALVTRDAAGNLEVRIFNDEDTDE